MRLVRLVALLALAGCKQQTYEELDAKIRAHDAEVKARIQQVEASKRAANEAANEAANRAAAAQEKTNRAKADAVKKANEEGMEKLRSVYTPMTPAQREKALRTVCERDEGCELQMRQAIEGAGATSAERAKLEAISARLVEDNIAQRAFYVGEVARDLISKGRHGFTVDADGPGKKRFVISGGFCSEEFLQGFVVGDWGAKARDRGFDRIDCGAWGRAL
jgi:Tfp pilus assembly major pilin PilA